MAQREIGQKRSIGAVLREHHLHQQLRVLLPFSLKVLLLEVDTHAGITHSFMEIIYSIPYYIILEAKQVYRMDGLELMRHMAA